MHRSASRVNFVPRTYYERDSDWLVTCPVCHGEGSIGKGFPEYAAQNVMEQEKSNNSNEAKAYAFL